MRSRLIVYFGLVVITIVAMKWLDVPVSRAVHEHSFSTGLKLAFRIARLPGDFRFTVVLTLLLVWRSSCHWQAGSVLLVASATASGITAVLKLVFGRTRPFKGREAFEWLPMQFFTWSGFATPNLSLPSGDATLAFCTAMIFATIVPRWRVLGFCWASIVATTRVLQGAHYPSDVIVGAIIGIGSADIGLNIVPTLFDASRLKSWSINSTCERSGNP